MKRLLLFSLTMFSSANANLDFSIFFSKRQMGKAKGDLFYCMNPQRIEELMKACTKSNGNGCFAQ